MANLCGVPMLQPFCQTNVICCVALLHSFSTFSTWAVPFLPWNFLQSYCRLFSLCSLGHIRKVTTLNHWSLTSGDLFSRKTLWSAFYTILQKVPAGMLLSCPQGQPAQQCTFTSTLPPVSYSLRSFTCLCLTISKYRHPCSQVLLTWELKDILDISCFSKICFHGFTVIIFKCKITWNYKINAYLVITKISIKIFPMHVSSSHFLSIFSIRFGQKDQKWQSASNPTSCCLKRKYLLLHRI